MKIKIVKRIKGKLKKEKIETELKVNGLFLIRYPRYELAIGLVNSVRYGETARIMKIIRNKILYKLIGVVFFLRLTNILNRV